MILPHCCCSGIFDILCCRAVTITWMNNRLFAPLALIEICHVGTCLSSKLLVRICVDYTLHPWPIRFLAAAGVRGGWPRGYVCMYSACKGKSNSSEGRISNSSIRYRKQPLAMAQRTCQLVPSPWCFFVQLFFGGVQFVWQMMYFDVRALAM